MVEKISPFDSHLSVTRAPLDNFFAKKGKGRVNKWDPAPYEEKPALQEGLNCITIKDPIRASLVARDKVKQATEKTFVVTKKEYNVLKDPLKCAEAYTDVIQHHVATRVSLFFQQAIVCYKTPFHYEVADTEGQIGSAKTLKIKTKNDPEIKIGFQAAHYSTIPGLKACPIDVYEKAIDNDEEVEYSPFLDGSYMEMLDNSTNGLPTFVNQIDTLIDGNSLSEDALRLDAIKLINEAARGRIDPCQATRKFLGCFLRQLENRPLASKTMSAAKLKTVSIYKEKVKEMIQSARAPDSAEHTNDFFDGLLSCNFSRAVQEDVPILRKIVYQRKFEIIREAQFTEAKIQKIIKEHFPKAVKAADKHAIRLCLTLQTKNDPSLNNVLQKLFAVSISTIEEDGKLCQSLQQKYRTDAEDYENALRDIRVTVRNFRRLENSYQAMLLRDFRLKLRGLTQKELAAKIDAVVNKEIDEEKASERPNARRIIELKNIPRSASTISRLENSRIHIQKDFKTSENQRRKALTMHQAAIISKALKVDPGHYFCAFFASSCA